MDTEALNKEFHEATAEISRQREVIRRLNGKCDHLGITLGEVIDERNRLRAEVEALRGRIDSAPTAIMDTRDVLGICAPDEEDFPALYALQGRRVALVVLVADPTHARGGDSNA